MQFVPYFDGCQILLFDLAATNDMFEFYGVNDLPLNMIVIGRSVECGIESEKETRVVDCRCNNQSGGRQQQLDRSLTKTYHSSMKSTENKSPTDEMS